MLILVCIAGRESDTPQPDTNSVTVQETMYTGKVISTSANKCMKYPRKTYVNISVKMKIETGHTANYNCSKIHQWVKLFNSNEPIQDSILIFISGLCFCAAGLHVLSWYEHSLSTVRCLSICKVHIFPETTM